MLGERYQVRRVVADGGMGRVYEALDMVDRRNVALKVLHADVAKDDVALERFKREFEVSKLFRTSTSSKCSTSSRRTTAATRW